MAGAEVVSEEGEDRHEDAELEVVEPVEGAAAILGRAEGEAGGEQGGPQAQAEREEGAIAPAGRRALRA